MFFKFIYFGLEREPFFPRPHALSTPTAVYGDPTEYFISCLNRENVLYHGSQLTFQDSVDHLFDKFLKRHRCNQTLPMQDSSD